MPVLVRCAADTVCLCVHSLMWHIVVLLSMVLLHLESGVLEWQEKLPPTPELLGIQYVMGARWCICGACLLPAVVCSWVGYCLLILVKRLEKSCLLSDALVLHAWAH